MDQARNLHTESLNAEVVSLIRCTFEGGLANKEAEGCSVSVREFGWLVASEPSPCRSHSGLD